MRMLAATVAILLFAVVVASVEAEEPSPAPGLCDGWLGPFGNLDTPDVHLDSYEAGKVDVSWIYSEGKDEPTCWVVERAVGDSQSFERVAVVHGNSGWRDPTYFADAVRVTYRVYAANNEARGHSGEASIDIPAHTPFVTPSTTLRGDVDCDLDLDVQDAATLLQGIAGLPVLQSSDSCYLEPLPGAYMGPYPRWGRTDYNCSDYLDAYDVVVLLRRIAGLPLDLHRFCEASWPS